jgi:uncharacterized protein YodC (DUF2158 family)
MNTFNVGDVVRQIHTGLEMEVAPDDSPKPGMVLCEWLDRDTDHQDAYFLSDQLQLVKPARVKAGEKIATGPADVASGIRT